TPGSTSAQTGTGSSEPLRLAPAPPQMPPRRAPSPSDVGATRAKLNLLARIPARTAVRLSADQTVQLADGRTRHALAGDWLVTRGRAVLDVVGDAQLAERYQIVDDATRLLSSGVWHP